MSALRIALVHNLPSGGGKRALFEWSRRLAARHDLHAFTLSTADHDFCDVRPFVTSHASYEFATSRLFETPLGRLNAWQRWRDLVRLDALGRRIAAAIDGGGFDVVFAHTCQFTFLPACLSFVRTPVAYYLHEAFGRAMPARAAAPAASARETIGRWLDRIDPLPALYRSRLDSVQRRGLASGVRLLANSAFTSARMGAAYGFGHPPICPYGVDGDAFRPLAEEARGGHVLSVGELSPRKGFLFLVDALGKLPAGRRPALRLACNAVRDDERARVEQRARESGVCLEVMVGLTTGDLVREYNRAALCVYAPHQEPFGLVPLEAMACGTAVVGVAEGGVRESVVHGRTGLLAPRDAEAFAQAVGRLLDDPALAAEYGRQGRAHVLDCWTWERSTAAIEAQLRGVVEGGPVGAVRCEAS
jgi:glycosyltransferase involved in cell wall biosynthesis